MKAFIENHELRTYPDDSSTGIETDTRIPIDLQPLGQYLKEEIFTDVADDQLAQALAAAVLRLVGENTKKALEQLSRSGPTPPTTTDTKHLGGEPNLKQSPQ
jgi:hypothetical protein